MTAALAADLAGDRLFLQCFGFLLKTGQGIKLAQDANDRLSMPEPAAERGRDPGQVLLNFKAFVPKKFYHICRRFKLFISRLGIVPKIVSASVQKVRFFVNDRQIWILFLLDVLLAHGVFPF